MKRILIILPNLDLGGTELVVMNYLRAGGLIFDFVVHDEAGYYEAEARALGARIFRVPTRSQGFWYNIGAMRALYKKYPEYNTVVVCSEHSFAFIELAVAWLSGVKTRAAWSHFSNYQGASRVKKLAHFIARPLLCLFANIFLACTQNAGEWLFGGTFSPLLKNHHIIKNAIDFTNFAFDPAVRERSRQLHGIPNEAFVLGVVGRLTPVKNHAFVLEVLKQLQNGSAPVNVYLLLVGDGELRAQLESEAKHLQASGRVIFAGQAESASYYSAFDAFLLPSLHEGLPLAALEAQAAGLPALISTTVTKEVKISESVDFLPIDGGVQPWVQKITALQAVKHNRIVDLSQSEYNIKNAAAKLRSILC
ncbi:MAG: glycosyltransferase [Defluviitaleaceae bacterium]|nr:glycosyltransferase [Defluviitaleaceae bacterium]MCL2273513.1 glycosyltransferase [Defluviitaleaceae bacterium]